MNLLRQNLWVTLFLVQVKIRCEQAVDSRGIRLHQSEKLAGWKMEGQRGQKSMGVSKRSLLEMMFVSSPTWPCFRFTTHKDNILTQEGMLKILEVHKVFNSTPYKGAFSDLCLRYNIFLHRYMSISKPMMNRFAPQNSHQRSFVCPR